MTENLDCSGFVFDTTSLSHFALIDRIDVLGDFVRSVPCGTSSVVLEEIRQGVSKHPQLGAISGQQWLAHHRIDDSIARLGRFVELSSVFGAQNGRNFGEASVLAVAMELGATAIIDDLSAKRVALAHYGAVHGTLWLLAQVWRTGGATETQLCNLVDQLADSGMRLPCKGGEFPDFVKGNKLGRWSRAKR